MKYTNATPDSKFFTIQCNKTLPLAIRKTLALGPKFVPPPSHTPHAHLVLKKLKNFFSKIDLATWLKDSNLTNNSSQQENFIPSLYTPSGWFPTEYSTTRSYSDITLPLLINILQPRTPTYQSDRNFHQTLHWLDKNPELMICNTDKNLGLKVIPRALYHKLVMTHLNNRNTYKLAQPVNSFKIFPEILYEIRRLNNIACTNLYPEIQRLSFTLEKALTNDSIPHFYILAKIHKPTLQGRPIAGAHSWITSPLSKLLCWILSKKIESLKWKHLLKNSYSLIQEAEKLSFKNPILVTIDIKSLYPSMDHSLTIEALENTLQFDSRLEKDFIRDATRLILKNSFVQYNQQVYLQTKGTAMGTNVAPQLANIYVTYTIERNRKLARYKNKLGLWRRFLDDILLIWLGSQEELDHFLANLDNYNSTLKFTYHYDNERIPFLDLWVRLKTNGYLEFSTYQKPLNLFHYLPRFSYHPSCIFKGFIIGELTRYARITTNPNDFLQMKILFRKRLLERGYRPEFLAPLFYLVNHNTRTISVTPNLAAQQITQELLQSFLNLPPNPDERKAIYLTLPYAKEIQRNNPTRLLLENWDSLPIATTHRPMVIYNCQRNLGSILTSLKRPQRPRNSYK